MCVCESVTRTTWQPLLKQLLQQQETLNKLLHNLVPCLCELYGKWFPILDRIACAVGTWLCTTEWNRRSWTNRKRDWRTRWGEWWSSPSGSVLLLSTPSSAASSPPLTPGTGKSSCIPNSPTRHTTFLSCCHFWSSPTESHHEPQGGFLFPYPQLDIWTYLSGLLPSGRNLFSLVCLSDGCLWIAGRFLKMFLGPINVLATKKDVQLKVKEEYNNSRVMTLLAAFPHEHCFF